MNQEKAWDQIAEKWVEFRKKPIQEVLDFLNKQKGNILDLGCGTGRHFIKTKKTKTFGVDFSEKMLKFAENKIKKENIQAVLIKSNFTKLPFPSQYFDSAIFIRALHCVQSEKNREKSLKELYRVLKKNSTALIQVWSKSHERLKNKNKGDYIPWTINGRQIQRYYYIYDKEEFIRLLEKVGFKILSFKEDKNTSVIIKKA